MLKIVTIPNSVLTTRTKKVERFDNILLQLVKDMDQTLRAQVNPQGVGLAAPQVNKNLAIFIIKPTPEAKTETFINPKILETVTINSNPSFAKASTSTEVSADKSEGKKKKKKTKLEGCLSIPKIWGHVERAEKVLLEFQDLTGKFHKRWLTGFKALIIQHEVDHLRGVLFTQRALEQNQQLFEEKDGELKKLLTK